VTTDSPAVARWATIPKLVPPRPREEDETASLVRMPRFREAVRGFLRTEEQRRYFDFVVDLPVEFLVDHAGERLTHERIAERLGIDQERIPSLNKCLKRAYRRAMKLLRAAGEA
jgi:hypothetical protein